MSDDTQMHREDGDAAPGHGAPHRRSFLKLGGATLLASGVAGSTAAARPAGTSARAVTGPADTIPADTVLAADEPVPPDLQSLVPIPPQRIPAAVAKLDSIIKDVMARTGVPGLAAAVVHDGSLLYAKGFGVRDVNSPARVNASTVFHLASVSKPLSATVVAGVVGQKVIGWTDPVVTHLPSFALADPYVTEHVTYADLFSHVSGLPDHAGDLLEDLGYDQAYILNRLRLEPLKPFRAEYEYTNFGLTAAANAAAAAAGRSWAGLADKVLFGPADMPSTSFRNSDFLRQANRAAMHIKVGDRWEQKYARDADPEAPAGGVSSNVLDLAHWLTVQLSLGAWNGRQIIGKDALSEIQLPRIRSGAPSSTSARSSFYGHGLGVSGDYAGRTRFSHSGGFNEGAATVINLLPSASLGIVVLTNGMPIGIPEAVAAYFYDYVEAGSEQDDWLTLYGQVFARLYVNHSELADKKPPTNPVPAQPDSFYTGTYANDYYGPIRIVAQGAALHLLIGPGPDDYRLSHWSGDLFSFYPTGENAVGITAATFHPNPSNSQAASVTLEYYDENRLGTFTRS